MKFTFGFLLIPLVTSLSSSSSSNSSSVVDYHGITPKCTRDIHGATDALTSAGIAIAKATTDCSNGFTSECNNDIQEVLDDLTLASQYITDAVYDCGGGEPTQCSADINAILQDISDATSAIMDAVLDCPVSAGKCTADIARASVAIANAVKHTAAAVNDC
eukprot:CAMPEP_0174821000 /NCGR_PEP_ID=MMETSP1107-20130205/5225_1 /TAXON_ID=36770 /ORGANISM="Paraphysomonas vestita, Strain GFlagA" /LENGTH=160 /DNA_ID=CAMNT_0016037491 /DNA_START=51 /DNA_END=533 /DNA_ORIENTATION=+